GSGSLGRGWIGRFSPSGALDAGFANGPRFDNDVYSLAIQPSGRIVVGGYCTAIDGIASGHITRLLGDIPGAPGPVRAVSASFSKKRATVRWLAPDSPPTPYTVTYLSRISKANSSKYGAWKSQIAAATTFPGLKKGAKYRVQIRAADDVGSSATVTFTFRQKR
ncbi:MAG: fibronectin type III domain-containing protein, partial [Actinomycetes bacterium]